jgi:hypothetical protein
LSCFCRQDESDASRKNLIELIRSFKKNNPEEIRQEELNISNIYRQCCGSGTFSSGSGFPESFRSVPKCTII